MNIDHNAPLVAKNETVISAPINKVWELLTEIDEWSRWQPDVTQSKLDSVMAVGTRFRWKVKGLNVTSVIQEAVPTTRIGWTGKSIGMSAVHMWVLEPHGNETRVITEESLSGWFPSLLKIISPRFLEKSLSDSVHTLKTEAERSVQKII